MTTLAILGAGGGLGRNAVDVALAAGHAVRALVRDPARAALPAGVTVVRGDATVMDDVAHAMVGADAALFCVNPPLSSWLTDFAPLVGTAVDAARRTGVRLVFPGNVWIYGRGTPGAHLAEDAVVAPTSSRGRLRAGLEATLRASGARVSIVRLPEFYGPHVVTLTARVFRAALDDALTAWPGPLDSPLELVFMPDGARALVDVATADGLDGRALHVGGTVTTPRAFAALVAAASGVRPRLAPLPAWALKLAGLVDPTARSAADISHLLTHPIILDGSAYSARFGRTPTPLEVGVAATVAWHRAAGRVHLQG